MTPLMRLSLGTPSNARLSCSRSSAKDDASKHSWTAERLIPIYNNGRRVQLPNWDDTGDIPVETLARFEKDVKRTDTGFLAIATEIPNVTTSLKQTPVIRPWGQS
ncbi:hypothetical protein CLOM_g13952 [Closterium sp. NIES-68]|nr:hypothetical protein CLOM_g13952 [Closterium sp. NIES-68]